MFRRTTTITAVITILAAGLTGCGSTSGGGAASDAQQNVAGQICGQRAAGKPGYPRTIPKVNGGAASLSGVGSTFVAPVMSAWTKDYSRSDGVQVAYQPIGSGGAVQQIVAGTVDFGASDTPMKDSELAAAKFGPILHIPCSAFHPARRHSHMNARRSFGLDGLALRSRQTTKKAQRPS